MCLSLLWEAPSQAMPGYEGSNLKQGRTKFNNFLNIKDENIQKVPI